MAVLFKDQSQERPHSRSGIAFIVEMLVLLVFISACLAVLVEAFAISHQAGIENSNTVRSVHLASDVAEDFAADPLAVPEVQMNDDLIVVTEVSQQDEPAGTLYHANIQVFVADGESSIDQTEPIYELETARYVKGGGR